jgi:hypothetical protein
LIGSISPLLSLAGVIDEELRHFSESSALLSVIDDHSTTTSLSGLDTLLNAVNEIGTTRADVGSKDIGAITLIMNANR